MERIYITNSNIYAYGIKKDVEEKNKSIFGDKLFVINLATMIKYFGNYSSGYPDTLINFESVFGYTISNFLKNYHNVEFINILSRRLNGFNWFDIYVDGFKPSEEEKELTNYYDMYELALRFDPSNIRDEFKIANRRVTSKGNEELIKVIKSQIKYSIDIDSSKILESCCIKFRGQDMIDLKRENYYPLWLTPSDKSYTIFTISPVLEIMNLSKDYSIIDRLIRKIK